MVLPFLLLVLVYRKSMVRRAIETGAVSVFKTRNGNHVVYCATMSLGFEDGDKKKRRFVRGYGDTEEQARSRMTANLARRLTSHTPTARRRSSPTLKAFCTTWTRHVEASGVNPSSRLKYQRDMENHVLPHIGDMHMESITPDDILNLFTNTLKDTGASAKSHSFRELKQLFIYAEKTKVITSNPMKDLQRPRTTVAISDQEDRYMDNYMSVRRGLWAWLWRRSCPYRDHRAMVGLLMLGLRREELLGLTWDRIADLDNPDKATVTVSQVLKRHETNEQVSGWYIRKSTKNNTVRSIRLTGRFRTALVEHRDRHLTGTAGTEWQNLVFPNPRTGKAYTYAWLDKTWRDMLDAYWHAHNPNVERMPDDHFYTAHGNRHILASILARNGVPIGTAQQILGHLDKATTIYYTHATKADHENAMHILSGTGRDVRANLMELITQD
ncbi:hypothetical protein CSQ85_09500 [Bifidobacterium rousetti]|nr:hypothetical protein CSQ85_09500 [Bifidobacterium rousetti]